MSEADHKQRASVAPRANWVAVLALSSLLGSACGDSSSSVEAQAPDSNPNSFTASTLEAGLVDALVQAPQDVKFGGVRRVEYHFESAGVARTMIYEERVTTAGDGRFAIDPLRLEVPVLSGPEREIFDAIQKEREGFFFRYRDFGVRGRELFRANYAVSTRDETPIIAGRRCTELEVRRIEHAQSWYIVDLDPTTALVMRYSEFGLGGELLARCEFTEFTLNPEIDGIEFFDGRYPGTSIDPLHEADANLGFAASKPRFLPSGYQHQRSELVHAGGRAWVRRVYGDGVESLFFVHGGPKPATATGAVGTPRIGATPISAEGVPDVITIRVCQVGPWTLAEAERGDENLFVIGKLSEADVIRVLRSGL